MSVKLEITVERMLHIMHYVIEHRLCDIDTEAAFAESIGSIRQSLTSIKAGKQRFTIDNILACCQKYGKDYRITSPEMAETQEITRN